MGVHNNTTTTTTSTTAIAMNDYGIDARRDSDFSMGSSPGMVQFPSVELGDKITDYIEMWDYVGGMRFRGFVAEKEDEKAMFVFFDETVIAGDLKAG
jgi:hypothetical protein